MKKKKAKIAKVVVKNVRTVAADHHVLEMEAEVHGQLPLTPETAPLPLEITPDAPEPEKRGFWHWFFGE